MRILVRVEATGIDMLVTKIGLEILCSGSG